MAYRRATRVDEAQNPIESFVLVPREDLERLDLGCCLSDDQRQRLLDSGVFGSETILADAAYISDKHWGDHGMTDLGNSELAQLVAGPGISAGAGLPSYTGEDLDRARRTSATARVELKLRHFSDEDISGFEAGHLPED